MNKRLECMTRIVRSAYDFANGWRVAMPKPICTWLYSFHETRFRDAWNGSGNSEKIRKSGARARINLHRKYCSLLLLLFDPLYIIQIHSYAWYFEFLYAWIKQIDFKIFLIWHYGVDTTEFDWLWAFSPDEKYLRARAVRRIVVYTACVRAAMQNVYIAPLLR